MKIKKGFSTTSLPTLLSRRVRQFSRSFEALFLFYSVVDVHVSDRKKYRTDPNSSSFYYYIFPEASDTPKTLVNWHCVPKTFCWQVCQCIDYLLLLWNLSIFFFGSLHYQIEFLATDQPRLIAIKKCVSAAPIVRMLRTTSYYYIRQNY